MPFAPKCQMPVNSQSIMISLGFHKGFAGVSLGFRWGFSILFGLEVWQVFICAEETTN